MIEYDICYGDEAFTREKGYMYPASTKFKVAKAHYDDKMGKLTAVEFEINPSRQKEEYEACEHLIQNLRLRIWINDVPFLEVHRDDNKYFVLPGQVSGVVNYFPFNEKRALGKMLYTKGEDENLFASKPKSSDGEIPYYYLESTHYEKDTPHDVYREISYESFLRRLEK